MLSSSQIKFLHSLYTKKNRIEEKLFIAEGPKIIGELMRSSYAIQGIYATKEWITQEQVTLNTKGINYIVVAKDELERISQLTTPNLVLAVAEQKDSSLNLQKFTSSFSLVLDNIRDPGNLGNIIRIADWFGIDDIYCSIDTVELYNPKVIQASMGSFIRVNIHYQNLSELLGNCKKTIPVYAAMLNGTNIHDTKKDQIAVVIIGNESKGVSDKLLKFVDSKITIPSFPHKNGIVEKAESLNAAIATAIVCFEFNRNL